MVCRFGIAKKMVENVLHNVAKIKNVRFVRVPLYIIEK
jgi:hypothetical protein